MTPKQALLDRAAREHQALCQAIDGLGGAELGEAWLGTWGVREIVGHIVGWQRELAPALARIARGERPFPEGVRYDDVDAWNARFAALMRDRTAPDLVRELASAHETFLRAAAEVPDERFQPGRTAYKIVDLNSAHHYQEHGAEIRAWRASRSAR
jgi:hypothetical protein